MGVTKEDVLKVIADPNEQRVITDRGITKVYRPSLARIASKLGVSKPTAQYHVANLEKGGELPKNLHKPVN